MSHPIVERLSPIDVNELNRVGALSQNSMASLYTGLRTSRRLVEWRDHRWPKDRPPQRILIQWTRCTYGGSRPWFICPCGKRTSKLYWGMVYGCRHCFEAIYLSQRRGRKGRLHLKAKRIRIRLGDNGQPGIDALPRRPLRMHRKTYRRLMARVEAIERRLAEGGRVYKPRAGTEQFH
jgi:hypothetical protein